MKRIRLLVTTLLLFASFACKRENNSPSPSNTSKLVDNGKWRVALFSENKKDETTHFAGYEFLFMKGGTVESTGSTGTLEGDWSASSDDDQTKFILRFPAAPLNELNNDWHVVRQSSTSLELEDVSGGNGGTGLLTFKKI